MDIQLILWEAFVNFLEILLFYIFIHTKLHFRDNCKHIQLKQFTVLLIRFLAVCVLNFVDVTSFITIFITCLLEITFALLFCNDAIVMRILWGSMYSVICLVSEYITIYLPLTFSNVTSPEILSGGALRMPFTLLYIALIAVMVFIFQCLSDTKIQLSGIQKFSYLVISVAGILIGHYIMVITLEAEELFHNPAFSFKLVLVNMVFLILFLILLLYIYRLGKSAATNAELLEQQKLLELEEMEYKTLLHTTESLREMKHDIDIHLDVIQSLAANGSLDDLQSYIADYHNTLAHTHNLLSTGNTAIDCILSSKIEAAQKLKIKTTFSVFAPSNFPIDAISLSSLLGNMWNNALDACQRLQTAQPDICPYIDFYIRPFQDMIIIHIENNFDKIIQRKDISHGIGIKRMKDIVAEADGIFHINTENHVFMVHIMIPQKEEASETNDINS